MATVVVSDKGQVVIPAALRRSLGIRPGTKLDFEREGDTIRASAPREAPASCAGGAVTDVADD